jgi:hypothetical protein
VATPPVANYDQQMYEFAQDPSIQKILGNNPWEGTLRPRPVVQQPVQPVQPALAEVPQLFQPVYEEWHYQGTSFDKNGVQIKR